MSRPRTSLGILPDDLYIRFEPWPRIGRPSKHDPSGWAVTDDWPDRVPITNAELGSKSDLLQTLTAAPGVKPATSDVRSSILKWRRERNWDRTFSTQPNVVEGNAAQSGPEHHPVAGEQHSEELGSNSLRRFRTSRPSNPLGLHWRTPQSWHWPHRVCPTAAPAMTTSCRACSGE